MSKKLQTIYEYFSDYTEKEIDDMISTLADNEKLIIKDRYGEDLHNPQPTENWNRKRSREFYGCLVPKMRKLLAKKTENNKKEELLENKEQNSIIEIVESPIELVDERQLLIHLLNEGKSNIEICEKLNINIKQLYEELLNIKNKGIMYSRKYYSDGSIKYNSISTMKDLKTCKGFAQDRTLITDINENSIKMLVLSDLHFGNELERIDLINQAYNYCVKNGINIILCCGDIIDGTFARGEQKITDLYEQIEYFIKNYPYDKTILTFAVAGDHDMSAFYKSSIDIIEICNNYRHDFIIGGYNNSSVNIKNDNIHLYHHTEGGTIRTTDAPIILHGHSHKFSTRMMNNSLNVTIPTLSDINQLMPGVLELNLYFNKGYIENTVIKHIYFGEHDVVLGEFTFDLSKRTNKKDKSIENVEEFKQKILTK